MVPQRRERGQDVGLGVDDVQTGLLGGVAQGGAGDAVEGGVVGGGG